MDKKQPPLKVMMSIVHREKVEIANKILNDLGSCGNWTMLGLGLDRSGKLSLLGLNDAECAVILSLVKSDQAHDILVALCRNLEFYKEDKGMAFTIPINAISRNTLNGLLELNKEQQEELKQQLEEQRAEEQRIEEERKAKEEQEKLEEQKKLEQAKADEIAEEQKFDELNLQKIQQSKEEKEKEK